MQSSCFSILFYLLTPFSAFYCTDAQNYIIKTRFSHFRGINSTEICFSCLKTHAFYCFNLHANVQQPIIHLSSPTTPHPSHQPTQRPQHRPNLRSHTSCLLISLPPPRRVVRPAFLTPRLLSHPLQVLSIGTQSVPGYYRLLSCTPQTL